MKVSYNKGSRILGLAIVAGLLGIACSSDNTNNGGTAATGGSTAAVGGSTATGGKSGTGGTSNAPTGGKSSTGGSSAAATTAVGGTTTAGGSSAVGGTTTAGGSSTIGGTTTAGGASSTSTTYTCGTTTSTYSETATFTGTAAAPGWELNTTSSVTGATFAYTTTSPTGSTICDNGCGVLSYTIPAGAAWGGGSIVNRWFATAQNLVGNSVKAQIALEVDAASAASVDVQLFAQGGSATSYAWGSTADATAAVTDTTTWHELDLTVANTGSFCASDTGAVGFDVQRKATTTADIPVKLYIKSVVIGSGTSTGTGGTTGAGGATGTSTSAGGTTTAGGATSTTAGGTTTAGGATASGGTTAEGGTSEAGGFSSTSTGSNLLTWDLTAAILGTGTGAITTGLTKSATQAVVVGIGSTVTTDAGTVNLDNYSLSFTGPYNSTLARNTVDLTGATKITFTLTVSSSLGATSAAQLQGFVSSNNWGTYSQWGWPYVKDETGTVVFSSTIAALGSAPMLTDVQAVGIQVLHIADGETVTLTVTSVTIQ